MNKAKNINKIDYEKVPQISKEECVMKLQDFI
jgi:hypothetical protein